MMAYVIGLLMILLFICSFVFFRNVIDWYWTRRSSRFRFHYVKKSSVSYKLSHHVSKNYFLNHHLRELLETVQSNITTGFFLMISFFLFLCGLLAGAFFFYSLKAVILLSLISSFIPYLILRSKLISVRLSTRLEFLPAIEIFYQYYAMSENKNIKNALKMCLEENRLSYSIRPVFEQLYRNLMTQQNEEEALRLFTLTLGHVWADYFVGIFRIALMEGNHVGANLKDLIIDMRKAQRQDQAERNRLLEIRIANFTPILFLAIFLFVNFKVNPENAYLYYVVDPVGRGLLLDALFLIFISFLMGIYLSLRRM